ncbi:MAG: DUF368 domain-containing protein [bacterium]
MNKFKQQPVNVLKGMAMGAANVIPGVSGGTIALVTGVFERLINAVKSFDIKALRLLFTGRLKEFAKHTDIFFLIAIFTGIAISIISLAKLLEYLFIEYPVYIWAFFFGLIISSVYYVGKTINKWSAGVIISWIIGTIGAILITLLTPSTENDNIFYLFVCGIVAMCSMILPGLSGSFILILLGNYKLIVIKAITEIRIDILLPVMGGAVFGLIAFSHLLSWLYKKYKDITIAVLSGFILGSLGILWPWQKPVYLKNEVGEFLLKDGEYVILKYKKFIPESLSIEVIIAILLMVAGIASIVLIERLAQSKKA